MRLALRLGIPRERWLDLTPVEFYEEVEAAVWREKRLDVRAVTTAWFIEAFARTKALDSLADTLEDIFPDAPLTEEEQAAQDTAAANVWARIIAAAGRAQEEAARKQAGSENGAEVPRG